MTTLQEMCFSAEASSDSSPLQEDCSQTQLGTGVVGLLQFTLIIDSPIIICTLYYRRVLTFRESGEDAHTKSNGAQSIESYVFITLWRSLTFFGIL